MMKTQIVLNELSTDESTRKVFFKCIAEWLLNSNVSDLDFVGTQEQIGIVKEAISESKKFQDSLYENNSSLKSISSSLNSRLVAIKKFEDAFCVQWML